MWDVIMTDRRVRRLSLLASGAVTLGVLQAIESISWNQIFFNFLSTLLNLLVTLVLGGNPQALFNPLGSGIFV